MSNQNQFNHVIRKKQNYAKHNLSYHNMFFETISFHNEKHFGKQTSLCLSF